MRLVRHKVSDPYELESPLVAVIVLLIAAVEPDIYRAGTAASPTN